MRGSSALLGAVDTSMECEKLSMDGDENRFGRFSVQKQKDGEDDIAFGYRMEKIGLSDIDPDATSLVVVPVDADALPARRRQPKAGAESLAVKIAIQTFDDAIAQNAGFRYTMNENTPGVVTALAEEIWKDRFYKKYPQVDDDKGEQIEGDKGKKKGIKNDSVRRAFQRTLEVLLKDGTFGHHNKKWWRNSFD